MQGSTVEAMSAAIEDADVMCYGISQAYKESANCHMEAQYAYQQQVDMVPLMMEEGYSANGAGSACCSVYGCIISFVGWRWKVRVRSRKVQELCRELGERGKGRKA